MKLACIHMSVNFSLHILHLPILSLFLLSVFLLAALSFYSHHWFPEAGFVATPPSILWPI